MHKPIFLALALFVVTALQAQVQFSGWLASFNTFRLSKKFSLHAEAQLRSSDKLAAVQTVMLRPGLNFHPAKNWMLTVGYGYVAGRRTVGNISNLLPEHRIWQQALFTHKLKTVLVAHRLRFEERHLSRHRVEGNKLKVDGFDQAYRLRYFVRNVVPLQNTANFSKGFFVALQNEVFLNTGDKSAVNGKTFDQNRAYAAVGYRLPAKLDVETGYMNQYTNTRDAFVNNHIVQLALYKRL